jgi:hypothetical protein
MNNSPTRSVNLQPACLHLRHKLMYVDEDQSTPGMVDDSSDTRIFFCTKTQESLGPDGEPVTPKMCHPGRDCHCSSL